MKTKSLLLFLCMFVSGCSVNALQIEKAESLCKDNGGIDRIRPALLDADVICKNGAIFGGVEHI